jgi:predicted membrane protein
MRSSRSPFGARLWFGLVILTLGVLWTLDNSGILDAGNIIDFWPLAVIAFGVFKMAGAGMARRPLAGMIWVLIGAAFAIDSLGIFRWDLSDAWPVFLILIGGMIVWKSLRGPRGRRGVVEVHVLGAERTADAGGPPEADTFSCVAVWAGVDRKATSQTLKGGDFTAVMGGGELDLRAARPVEGGAEVEVLVIMGGLDVYVPEDWNVINDVQVVMGAVEDNRKIGVPPGDRTLVLKGFVMMGGVEIKT